VRGGEKKWVRRSSKIERYDVTGAPRTEEQKEKMKIKNSRERRRWAHVGRLDGTKGVIDEDTCYYSTIHTARNGDEEKRKRGQVVWMG